jgi:cyclopropane-fatty-acyl-phospholipid synthase
MLLARMLERIIHSGALTLIDPKGKRFHFGDAPPESGVIIRLTDPALPRKLFFNAHLHLGEAYMDGTLRVEQGSIYDLLALVSWNMGDAGQLPLDRFARPVQSLLRFFQQFNPIPRARRNVAHHYDLSGELYDLFLDDDRQYSCAYFTDEHSDLERAQRDKKRHLASKLLLNRPDLSVLDIGSGWGGMGLYLASIADCQVTGVTLSKEQFELSNRRARDAGLAARAEFRMTDYRSISGKFDRIVSVGMFEHVGLPHYRSYFRKIRDLLTDDGVAVVHSIGRMDGPGITNQWVRKYIFPGGYSPALSEVLPVIEDCGLWVNDVEILRLHYAETLRLWRMRFLDNRDRARHLYDERFCRMWEFYLAASEATFRYRGHMVFQIQITKSVDVLPLTRDYMFDDERRLTRLESDRAADGLQGSAQTAGAAKAS